MRLDQALASRFPGLSRRKARELIAQRRVLVNDRPVAIASREVGPSDRITIAGELPEIEIVRETGDWLAVNKPAGMPAQPPRDRRERSLEELLRIRYKSVFLVHRIDTPASGLMLFARTKESAARLSRLFASGAIRKTYLAVVAGAIERETTIDAAIDGRRAVSHVRPRGGALVEVEIETGRTHQIRIHLASIGHPIAGDTRYGGPPAPRLMLHAWKLEHPEVGSLVAPPPPGFPSSSSE